MYDKHLNLEACRRFAGLSGNWNPLHVDPLVARRLLVGRPVVHCMHIVMRAFDQALPSTGDRIALRYLRVQRMAPVGIGTPLSYQVTRNADVGLQIDVAAHGKSVLLIDAEFQPSSNYDDETIADASFAQTSPDCPPDDALRTLEGQLDLSFDRKAAKALFPTAARRLPVLQLAQLLACSRTVGMNAPGFHSLFGELELDFSTDSQQQQITYSVRQYERTDRKLAIDVNGQQVRGSVHASLRRGPCIQLPFDEINSVTTGEFGMQRALVIGGSRGLGEVSAKLLAAGGADVRITYLQGMDDAENVVRQIQEGGGTASYAQLDALDPERTVLSVCSGTWLPTHLYYFATPPIEVASNKTFSTDLFRYYCAYYVDGFASTLAEIQKQGIDELEVYYPSSVHVVKPPFGMEEYSVAKKAGEALCDVLGNGDGPYNIFRSRLPRMATDQTADHVDAPCQDPLPVMLDQLRRCRDASRASIEYAASV